MSRTLLLSSLAVLLLAATSSVRAQAPKVLEQADAVCTAEAQQQGVRGTVTLRAEIDNAGVPTNIEPVTGWQRGTCYPALGFGLEEAAVEAVSQWRFTPSALGAPVRTVQLEMGFRCNKPLKALFPRPE